MNRLYKYYEDVLAFDYVEKNNKIKDQREIPSLEKIVIHMNLKDQKFQSKKFFLSCMVALELITGQRGQVLYSKKDVALWRLRSNDITGFSVTLTDTKMYIFIDRLVTFIFPKIKPMLLLTPKLLDKQGNLNFRLNSVMIFPEIEREYLHFLQNSENPSELKNYLPLDITFVTKNSCEDKNTGIQFFSSLLFPVSKN